MGDYVMTIVWGAVFILTLLVEAQTAELVSIWFMPGALVSLILSLFKVETWVQCVVFIAVSAVLLILAKTVFRKRLMKKVGKEKTDIDLLIGQVAIVEEQIKNIEAVGTVKLKGQLWTARMTDDGDTALPGERVIVESISGVKLICRRADGENK